MVKSRQGYNREIPKRVANEIPRFPRGEFMGHGQSYGVMDHKVPILAKKTDVLLGD